MAATHVALGYERASIQSQLGRNNVALGPGSPFNTTHLASAMSLWGLARFNGIQLGATMSLWGGMRWAGCSRSDPSTMNTGSNNVALGNIRASRQYNWRQQQCRSGSEFRASMQYNWVLQCCYGVLARLTAIPQQGTTNVALGLNAMAGLYPDAIVAITGSDNVALGASAACLQRDWDPTIWPWATTRCAW